MTYQLTTVVFVALLALVIFLLWKDASMKSREGLTTGGYFTSSGLYFNNNAKNYWVSEQDGQAYESVIGKVVV